MAAVLPAFPPKIQVADEANIYSISPNKIKECNVTNTEEINAPCLIGTVPLEILAEILSYTLPRDVLAFARTSRYFCNTLVSNPASQFIWAKARVRFTPVIPPPTPNFTESAYAAFLFDPGVCEVGSSYHRARHRVYNVSLTICATQRCKKRTKAMYASFALRLRLCDKVSSRHPDFESCMLLM